jgi:hypothetical protein
MTIQIRLFALMLFLGLGPTAVVAAPNGRATELVTAVDAVLCLDEASLDRAGTGRPMTQTGLRNLGCLRSPAGVPATLLDDRDVAGALSVRYRPSGMSGGVTLWGRPSAFTLPDGTALRSQRAEK